MDLAHGKYELASVILLLSIFSSTMPANINSLPSELKLRIFEQLDVETLRLISELQLAFKGPNSLREVANSILHRTVCIKIPTGRTYKWEQISFDERIKMNAISDHKMQFITSLEVSQIKEMQTFLHHTKEIFILCGDAPCSMQDFHLLTSDRGTLLNYLEGLPNLQTLECYCSSINFALRRSLQNVHCFGKDSTFLLHNSRLTGTLKITGTSGDSFSAAQLPNFSNMSLVNLQELHISNMNFDVIDGDYFELPNLKKLFIKSATVTTIRNFKRRFLPKLEMFVLKNLGALKTISNVHAVKIGTMDLPKLKDLQFVRQWYEGTPEMTKLLNLETAKFTENRLKVIENWFPKKLKSLNLSKNSISFIQNLENLKHLETLNLDNNDILEIQGLDTLTNLKILSLSGNKIKKLGNLDKLVKLEKLILATNPIVQINQKFSSFLKLRNVLINSTQIEDVTPLHQAKYLEVLDISNTKVKKIGSLSQWPNLRQLRMEGLQRLNIGNLALFS